MQQKKTTSPDDLPTRPGLRRPKLSERDEAAPETRRAPPRVLPVAHEEVVTHNDCDPRRED
jgi:hypothetical protein